MSNYCESIDGSFIEDHESMILWNYDLVEPEYGLLSAKQMKDDLLEALKFFNVEVIIGKSYVEVKNKNVKKETLVEKNHSRIFKKSWYWFHILSWEYLGSWLGV